MSFTTVTVTAKFSDDQGNPRTGRVTFTASGDLQDTSTGEIRTPTPIPANLDATGSISVELTATDDSTTTPTDVVYTVVEEVTGVPLRTYQTALSHTHAPTVELSTLAPQS